MVMAGAEDAPYRQAGVQNPIGVGHPPPAPRKPRCPFPQKAPSLDRLSLRTMAGPPNGSRRSGASLLCCLHLWLETLFFQFESFLLELRP